jgi:hypothetical protein
MKAFWKSLKIPKRIIRIKAKLVEQNLSDRTTSLEKQHNSTSLKLEEKTVSLQQAHNSTSLKLQNK